MAVYKRYFLPAWSRHFVRSLYPTDVVWIYTDSVLFHAEERRDGYFERLLRDRRVPYVFHVPDALPITGYEPACARRVEMARLTAAITPTLADLLRLHHPSANIETLEEAIDLSLLPEAFDTGATAEKTILWAGPNPKAPDSDLGVLYPVLQEVWRHVPFTLRIVTGRKRPRLDPGVPWTWFPYTPDCQSRFFSGAIASVIHYKDDAYGRCKGNYKVKTHMGAGKAVITSDLGYNRVLIRNGFNGLLASNPQEWRDHLLRVLRDPPCAKTLGRAARQTIQSRYSFAAIGKHYAQALRRHVPEACQA